MNKLKEFDELLANKTITDDGWYDYMQDKAISRAKNFEDTDWKELTSLWKTRDEDWQIRLAGILGSYNPSKTVQILEAITNESKPTVIAEAINSLEGMDGDGYLYVPGENILQQMEKIYSNTKDPILRSTIETLQARAKKEK